MDASRSAHASDIASKLAPVDTKSLMFQFGISKTGQVGRRKLATHDGAIRELSAAIRQLLAPTPLPAKREIDFHPRLLPPPASQPKPPKRSRSSTR